MKESLLSNSTLNCFNFIKTYNPWQKPVVSDAEIERWIIPAGKPATVDSMLL